MILASEILSHFRQQEENHIMENILYNELRMRGYNVDVEWRTKTKIDGNTIRKQYEVDFVVNEGSNRYYIQPLLRKGTARENFIFVNH